MQPIAFELVKGIAAVVGAKSDNNLHVVDTHSEKPISGSGSIDCSILAQDSRTWPHVVSGFAATCSGICKSAHNHLNMLWMGLFLFGKAAG